MNEFLGEIVAFMRYFSDAECEMLPYLTNIADDRIQGYVESKGGVESMCGVDQCLWSDKPIESIKL